MPSAPAASSASPAAVVGGARGFASLLPVVRFGRHRVGVLDLNPRDGFGFGSAVSGRAAEILPLGGRDLPGAVVQHPHPRVAGRDHAVRAAPAGRIGDAGRPFGPLLLHRPAERPSGAVRVFAGAGALRNAVGPRHLHPLARPAPRRRCGQACRASA